MQTAHCRLYSTQRKLLLIIHHQIGCIGIKSGFRHRYSFIKKSVQGGCHEVPRGKRNGQAFLCQSKRRTGQLSAVNRITPSRGNPRTWLRPMPLPYLSCWLGHLCSSLWSEGRASKGRAFILLTPDSTADTEPLCRCRQSQTL